MPRKKVNRSRGVTKLVAKSNSQAKVPKTVRQSEHNIVAVNAAVASFSTNVKPTMVKLCRLCEAREGPFLNIFDADKILAKKIIRLLPIAIDEYDKLPHKICFRCSAKVEELNEFVEKCIRTQENLKRSLTESKAALARKQWEEKLKISKMSNEDFCDALIKEAMQKIGPVPDLDPEPEPKEIEMKILRETEVVPHSTLPPMPAIKTRGRKSNIKPLEEPVKSISPVREEIPNKRSKKVKAETAKVKIDDKEKSNAKDKVDTEEKSKAKDKVDTEEKSKAKDKVDVQDNVGTKDTVATITDDRKSKSGKIQAVTNISFDCVPDRPARLSRTKLDMTEESLDDMSLSQRKTKGKETDLKQNTLNQADLSSLVGMVIKESEVQSKLKHKRISLEPQKIQEKSVPQKGQEKPTPQKVEEHLKCNTPKVQEDNGSEEVTDGDSEISDGSDYDIMQHVSTIKVGGAGLLYQCKLCKRNFLKKEVVLGHNCAKARREMAKSNASSNEPKSIHDCDVKPKTAPLPNPVPKASTLSDKDIIENFRKKTSQSLSFTSSTEQKEPPKPKPGPASRKKQFNAEPNVSLNKTQDAPTTSVSSHVGKAANQSVVEVPTTFPGSQSRYKLVPGPNNTYTLVGESSSSEHHKPKPVLSNSRDESPAHMTHTLEADESPTVKPRQEIINLEEDKDRKPQPVRVPRVASFNHHYPNMSGANFTSYQQSISPAYQQPGPPAYQQSGHPAYQQPGPPSYQETAHLSYQQPGGSQSYQQTGLYQQSGYKTYQQSDRASYPQNDPSTPISIRDPMPGPYPVGLFQAIAKPVQQTTFATPAMKKQSYTVVQTGHPSKLLISTKQQPPSPTHEQVRANSKKVKQVPTINQPYHVTTEESSASTNSEFFSFVNVDPLLEPSYVLPTANTIQESQITTSSQPNPNMTKQIEIEVYSCEICHMKFSREKKLLAHLQTHYAKMDDHDDDMKRSTKKRQRKS